MPEHTDLTTATLENISIPSEAALKPSDVVLEDSPCSISEDPKAKKEEKSLFDRIAKKKNAKILSIYIDIGLRIVMSVLFFALTAVWIVSVVIILCRQHEAVKPLSDTVLVTLLTTTTFNVIGLLAVVSVYLFPSKTKRKQAAAAIAQAK